MKILRETLGDVRVIFTLWLTLGANTSNARARTNKSIMLISVGSTEKCSIEMHLKHSIPEAHTELRT